MSNVITTAEIASLLGCSARTVRRIALVLNLGHPLWKRPRAPRGYAPEDVTAIGAYMDSHPVGRPKRKEVNDA